MESTKLLRIALEEHIRMGPKTRLPLSVRLAERARQASDGERAAALAEIDRAVAAAEALAREYQDGKRTQVDVVAELRRRFPWLGDSPANSDDDLAMRLGSFGYYLVIM